MRLEFGDFLKRHLHGSAAILVFYTNETTPGNAFRPDKGRTFEALTFTFLELPLWYIARKHGYFKFAYILSDVTSQARGGFSHIAKKMLYKVFDPSFLSFGHSGMRVPSRGGLWHLVGELEFWILDEKGGQGQSLCEVKGASGLSRV